MAVKRNHSGKVFVLLLASVASALAPLYLPVPVQYAVPMICFGGFGLVMSVGYFASR